MYLNKKKKRKKWRRNETKWKKKNTIWSLIPMSDGSEYIHRLTSIQWNDLLLTCFAHLTYHKRGTNEKRKTEHKINISTWNETKKRRKTQKNKNWNYIHTTELNRVDRRWAVHTMRYNHIMICSHRDRMHFISRTLKNHMRYWMKETVLRACSMEWFKEEEKKPRKLCIVCVCVW